MMSIHSNRLQLYYNIDQDREMQKHQSFSFRQLAEIATKQPSLEDSQYLNQYNHYFSHFSKYQQSCIELAGNLRKYGIQYNPDIPYQPFKVSIESRSKNSEIAILSVTWGHFSQTISAISFLQENDRTNRPYQIQGSSNVILYERPICGQRILFKSQLLTPYCRSTIILSVIKELIIAKIGSALGFGPYCHMDTYFDLFIYDNCIEFGMEKCLGFQDESFGVQDQEELKECLLTMHFFRVIHFDIKPANIMISKHFKKFILIDFNLSDVSDYQLGKKSQIPFRGTVNFCCPEMAYNFLSANNQVKKVDPYYNDVFCLQQSIKLVNKTMRKAINPIRLDYFNYVIEENKEVNDILFIKKMMYLQDWGKVHQFFAQSIFDQKSSKMLIEFLYELDLTQDLQIFYNTVIPSGLKETLLTRQFEYLLRKKWMFNTENSIMTEKKLQFQNRLDFTLVQNERKIIELTKEEVFQYLNNQEKFTASKELYFSVFLDYWILTATNNNENKDNIVPNLILQILPITIILDLGTLEQNLQWYEQMLCALSENQDKLCFLLSLKQLNEWNRNKIGRKGTQSRFVASQKTNQFAILGFRNFNFNCSKQLKKIVQFALDHTPNTDESISIKYEGANANLKRIVKKQQLDRFLKLQSHNNTSIEKVCRQIQSVSDSPLSFEHFYFTLFQRYKIIGGSDFCTYIKRIYSQNIKDQHLERQFSIHYRNVVEMGSNKLLLTSELEKIEEHVHQIEDQDVGLSQSLVERASNISQVLDENRQRLTRQEYNNCFLRIEKINQRLKQLLYKYFMFRVERKGMKVHQCFNPRQQFNLYVYDIGRFEAIEQCRVFFSDMIQMEEFLNCCHCAFTIECFIVICLQTWILAHQPADSVEIFVNLKRQLQSIKAKHFCKQLQPRNQLIFRQAMCHMVLNQAVFCTFDKEHEMKYKGLTNLYIVIQNEIKTNNWSLMWIYFGIKQTNKALLQYTMRILFENMFNQLINFLILLAIHLDRHFASSNFNVLLLCFMRLLANINFHQQLAIQQSVRKQIKQNPKLKNQLTIYFYCLATVIPDAAIKQRLYFRIAPTLTNFPFDLQIFYSSAIYLHFAKKLRSQEKKSERRQLYINNKLVKLMLRKWQSEIEKEKRKKCLNCKNIYMRLLVRKLKRIEGPISTIMDSTKKYEYSMKHIH